MIEMIGTLDKDEQKILSKINYTNTELYLMLKEIENVNIFYELQLVKKGTLPLRG
jgi:hypothetical protein